MRSPTRSIVRLTTLASILFAAAPSLAQPGATDAAPAAAPAAQEPSAPEPPPPLPPPATPAPAPPARRARAARSAPIEVAPPAAADADRPGDGGSSDGDPRRGEGVRLGLDLGFQRAVDGSDGRVNDGTPTILPLGLDVSFRQGPYTMLGLHGYAALGSRDDCISADSCRTRAYGFGGHVEHPLGRGTSFAPWIRYGAGYELVYHGGAPLDDGGHRFRGALDMLDVRIGADLIVSRNETTKKTMRIGGFLGLVGGLVVYQSGISHQSSFGGTTQSKNLDNSTQSGHLWVGMGLRATLDP